VEPKRQREIALGSVALVLLAIAAWALLPNRSSAGSSRAGGTTATAPAQSSQPGTAGALGAVNLDGLKGERPQPADDSVRNPFTYKPRPAPPPPAAQQPSLVKDPAGSVQTGPPQPPPPPRITLKYIGEVADPRKPGGKIAVLSDGRGVYYGREGEVVEGRYRVLKIGVESVELAYLDGRGRQTIRQTGQ
jgi:hypothetical protein